jgi:predicted membrane channel-forming protein YqfA (hemolysin III family)
MLVTLLLCCLARVAIPDQVRLLPLFVFLFAACVEIGQYFDIVALLGLADNQILSIVLGRTFSWLDLVCYTVGCVAAFGVDRIIGSYKRRYHL